SSGGGSLRGCARRTSTFETVAFGGASARFFWTSRSGCNRRLFASTSIADARLSLKEDWQSSAEANRLSKDAGRSSKASKRSSNGALRHAAADVSVGMGAALAGASNNPTCGSRLANRTRSLADPDPSGALRRKTSGWIVPKTETRRPGNVSAGPACVPADLRMNPRTIAANSKRNRAEPKLTQYAPHSYATFATSVAPHGNARPPETRGSKHADCGKNRSSRSSRRLPVIANSRRVTSDRMDMAVFLYHQPRRCSAIAGHER